jgi:hypothetical protein
MHIQANQSRKRKRGLSDDVSDRGTPALPSLTNNLNKRVFGGYKRSKATATTPAVVSALEEDMSELVHFILDHEEAFQRLVAPYLLHTTTDAASVPPRVANRRVAVGVLLRSTQTSARNRTPTRKATRPISPFGRRPLAMRRAQASSPPTAPPVTS